MHRRGDEGETASDCQAEAERATADLPARLSEDVLADVLRRLAPRDIAASRSVCKAWRAVVDGCRLLRTELLPLWVGGIFIDFFGYHITELFSRPSASRPAISGKHDYLPGNSGADEDSWSAIIDHCNGLLLVEGYDYSGDRGNYYLLNPATRWCAPLPPLSTFAPNMKMDAYGGTYDLYKNIYDKYLVERCTTRCS